MSEPATRSHPNRDEATQAALADLAVWLLERADWLEVFTVTLPGRGAGTYDVVLRLDGTYASAYVDREAMRQLWRREWIRVITALERATR